MFAVNGYFMSEDTMSWDLAKVKLNLLDCTNIILNAFSKWRNANAKTLKTRHH
jgi:hypothetical protein